MSDLCVLPMLLARLVPAGECGPLVRRGWYPPGSQARLPVCERGIRFLEHVDASVSAVSVSRWRRRVVLLMLRLHHT